MRSDVQRSGVEGNAERGDESREVSIKAGGEGGDGAAFGDPKLRPAVEKPPERAVGFAEIDVFPARFGHCGGEFGVGECAKEAEDAGEDPDGEEHSDRADAADHAGGDEEDTAADDSADDDGDGAGEAEDALEGGG